MSSKLREALERSTTRLKGVVDCYPEIRHLMQDQIAENEAALAEPVRNCDVGTAEEQEERYIKLKREHVDKLARCPAMGCSFFFPDSLYWAQMPYESEVK